MSPACIHDGANAAFHCCWNVRAWLISAGAGGYGRIGSGRDWPVSNPVWGYGGPLIHQFVISKGATAIYFILTLETGLRCVFYSYLLTTTADPWAGSTGILSLEPESRPRRCRNSLHSPIASPLHSITTIREHFLAPHVDSRLGVQIFTTTIFHKLRYRRPSPCPELQVSR